MSSSTESLAKDKLVSFSGLRYGEKIFRIRMRQSEDYIYSIYTVYIHNDKA